MMKKLTENDALALLFANLKERKKKVHDWVTIASACKFLVDLYGSPKKVADTLSVSQNLIHQIIKITTLPKEVQKLIADGKILLDAANQIATLASPSAQINVATLSVGLSSKDVRELVQYARNHEDASLEEFKNILREQKKTEKINLLILPISEDIYSTIKKISNKNKCSPEKLVISWIKEKAITV